MKFRNLVSLTVIALFAVPALAQESGESVSSGGDNSNIKRGGFYLEPMVMATKESSSIKTSQLPLIPNNTSGTLSGYGVGLRLGAHIFETVLIGAEGRYSRMRLEDSAYQTAEGDLYNYGPYLGVQLPFLVGLRLVGTYVMGGQYDPGAGANGFDIRFRNATGYRIGASFRVAVVAINLEYENLNYANTDVQSIGALNVQQPTDVQFASNGYTLGVSFPVDL